MTDEEKLALVRAVLEDPYWDALACQECAVGKVLLKVLDADHSIGLADLRIVE